MKRFKIIFTVIVCSLLIARISVFIVNKDDVIAFALNIFGLIGVMLVAYNEEMLHKIKGGNSGGVPPLPIPNRAVKPACADGTAKAGE